MADENDELIQDFLIESYENLDQLDRDFVALEQNPDDRERLGGIFRTIHTIKGTSGFLAFGKLEQVTHVGENLLSRLRDGTLGLSEEITSGLLSMVDAVREMLSNIETLGGEGDTDYSALVDHLRALNADSEAPPANDAKQVAVAEEPATVVDSASVSEPPIVESSVATDVSGDEATGAVDPGASVSSVSQSQDESANGESAAQSDAPGAGSGGDSSSQAKPVTSKGSIADTSIRVDVNQLDRLMNLVGELVLARNQILQHSTDLTDGGFLATCQRLNLITTELQEGVMKTRMQPIGNVWSKFPRVARDLATASRKRVKVVMEGKDTEVDKTILESIKDPLTHIVRNSCDHGLETPEERIAAGKPEEGTIRLRAYHEGGQVNIEVSDDGRGIDPEKVKNKALSKGLVSRQQVDQMTDRDLVNLIFAPGFSTAEQVTNVSGRGVGMDVVRTNIEKIGGTVDIHNMPGEGTTLKVKIPLTLAIIPALIVTAQGERYAIPQVSLLELVRLEGEDVETGIERVHGALVYRLRGSLLPLVSLSSALRLETAAVTAPIPVEVPSIEEDGGQPETDEQEAIEVAPVPTPDASVNIVVLQAGDRSFGLIVDEVSDTEEIVVKPLGSQLKGITEFSGATIMGDGRVALILDVVGLAHNAGLVAEGSGGSMSDSALSDEVGDEDQMLLVCGLGDERRIAIPLSLVGRLEEFSPANLEMAAGKPVIQYRGQIMPLVYISDLLGVKRLEGNESLHVVVHETEGRSVGLVVDEILDVVETRVQAEDWGANPGLAGAVVVQGSVTDLVDVDAIVQRALPASTGRSLGGLS